MCEGWGACCGAGPVGGVRRGGVRAVGAAGLAGEGPVVSAGPAVGRPTQFDAADGRASRGGPSAVAAVHDVLDLAGRGRAGSAGMAGGAGGAARGVGGAARGVGGAARGVGGAARGVGGGRHRFPQRRHRITRGVPAVLGHVGQGRQLPDRRQCPRRFRYGLVPAVLAAVPARSWDRPEMAGRRKACRIPDTEHHRPKWELALEMLDELAGTGLRPAALVADTGCSATADFRHGLEDRGLAYVLQVKGEMTAHGQDTEPHRPAYGGLGPRPLPRYRTRPVSLREHVMAAGRDRGGNLTRRKGSKAAMSSHFVLLRVRLAGRRPKPATDGTIRSAG
ncbi:transposase [Streptomyces sp. NBC_01367]